MSNRTMTLAALAAIALLGAGAAIAGDGGTAGGGEGPAGGTGALVFHSTRLVYGDVAAAGVGLRGVGSGDIVLGAIPTGAVVGEAYLYWATLGTDGTFTAPTLNGQAVAGTMIASGPDTCWGVTGNFVYRATVTGLVAGNGTYTVAGLPAGPIPANDSQGASLVVVWHVDSPGIPQRSVLIHDGSAVINAQGDFVYDNLANYTTSLAAPDAALITIIGDGQGFIESLALDGNPLGTNPVDGSDGPMWDTDAYDVTGLVTGAPVSLSLGIPSGGDCLLQVADVLSVATGTVRPIQDVPTLGSWGLAALALALLGGAAFLLARRRGQARVA